MGCVRRRVLNFHGYSIIKLVIFKERVERVKRNTNHHYQKIPTLALKSAITFIHFLKDICNLEIQYYKTGNNSPNLEKMLAKKETNRQ